MIPKLRVKLHESILQGKLSNSKARAAGYNHTYYDNEGLDLEVLSRFPTDEEIVVIAGNAAEEADSLMILLGLCAEDLHGGDTSSRLPSIEAWFGDVMVESDAEGEDEVNDVEELQAILDDEENSPISRKRRFDEECLRLTTAALAVATEEAAIV